MLSGSLARPGLQLLQRNVSCDFSAKRGPEFTLKVEITQNRGSFGYILLFRLLKKSR